MSSGDAELQELEELEVAAAEAGRTGDVATLARRSLLNFGGGAAFGLLNFLWIVLVTRGWGAARAGVLLEAVAFFTIATGLVVLGSEESVLRAVSRTRALGMSSATRHTLLVALVPILVFSTAIAALVWILAPRLSELFLMQDPLADRVALATYMRTFAPALPFTGLYLAVLAATRGFGTMVPTVAIERIGRTGAQLLLAGIVIAAGLGTIAMGLAWVLPYEVGLVFAAVALRRAIRRDKGSATVQGDTPPLSSVASEYWRFSGLRGLASIFQITSLWIDTLLVGTLVSASLTAVYTTAARTVRLGSIVLLALIQAMAPQISDLLTKREPKRAEYVYQTSTWWTMTLTWPLYLLLAIFAPVILRIFGQDFGVGAQVVVIMSAAMLFSTSCGPVDMVLLMGGKSGWNLINNVVSLTVDIVLILVLVPHFGIEGAAVAWAASVIINNAMPWIEVRILLGITPFARPGLIPAAAAIVSFGLVGFAVRSALGLDLKALIVAGIVGTVCYALLLRRFGGPLELASLPRMIRRRPIRETAASEQTHGLDDRSDGRVP